MRGRAVFMFLLFVMVFPIQSVVADENDSSLQARETQAEFLPDIETTMLHWRNIETADGLLLDQLKMATYEVHRKENGRFFSNSITPETLIAQDIPACYMNDLNEVCSGKAHSIMYEPSPGTQSNVYYAIVTVLRDGTRTEDVNIGFSQTPDGHIEIVAPSIAPEEFTASYDVTNQTTHFSWRPSCPQSGLSHALYEHSAPASKSTWDSMDKMLVTNFIPSDASEFSFEWENESVERSVYYSLTCFYPPYCDDDGCYPAREDTRFHSGNTLQNPIVEDNQAPRFAGSLSAQYNSNESQTVLQWSQVLQNDIAKVRIYHASKEIVSVEQGGVQVLAELDSNSIEFIHHLPADWMLTSYYAIGLVDNQGNIQIDEFDVSGKVGPIVERNIPVSITSFSVEQQNSTLLFEWELRSEFMSGDAVLWTSQSPNPDMSPAWEEVTRLNPTTLEHHLNLESMQEAWYALTLDGTWGSSPSIHADDRIYLGMNAVLFTPITEEEIEDSDDETSPIPIDLPEFSLSFDAENQTLKNGDWVTLESKTNQSYTLLFTHSQVNSSIRWTDALTSNPFWRAATTVENGFSISIEEPINLIHIESTDANGDISIVRVGIDWPDEQEVEPKQSNDTELIEQNDSSEEESVSMPLLLVIGIIGAYILIILSIKPKDELALYGEEE